MLKILIVLVTWFKISVGRVGPAQVSGDQGVRDILWLLGALAVQFLGQNWPSKAGFSLFTPPR
jgi:hypothetical protein